jgi:endo-1,4-beta-xylanase
VVTGSREKQPAMEKHRQPLGVCLFAFWMLLLPVVVWGQGVYTVPQALQARIEKHRMVTVSVQVLDVNGRPVGNQSVHFELRRHAFLFGSTLPMPDKIATHSDWYHREMARLFNYATTEDLLKWSVFEPESGKRLYNVADEYAAWCKSANMHLKGHTLVWADPQGIPSWLDMNDMAGIMQRLETHVRDVVRRYRGRIDVWDVVNEPVHRSEWSMIDSDYLAKVFKWARAENPDATLLLNEYGVFQDPDLAEAYFSLAAKLKRQGVPVDGIGIQAHTVGRRFPPERVEQVFAQTAALGLPVHITEFDVPTEQRMRRGNDVDEWTPHSQGQYYGDFFARCFAQPEVVAITIWGHFRNWSRGASLFTDKREPKPNWKVLNHLINELWHTNVTLKTSADGRVDLRGYLGDYAATWEGGSGRFSIAADQPRLVVRPE